METRNEGNGSRAKGNNTSNWY